MISATLAENSSDCKEIPDKWQASFLEVSCEVGATVGVVLVDTVCLSTRVVRSVEMSLVTSGPFGRSVSSIGVGMGSTSRTTGCP